MIWPNLCVDNFYDNPEQVIQLANSLTYKSAPDGRWPGTRSEYMHTVNNEFFNFTCLKILSLFYPHDAKDLQYMAEMYFQKIDSNHNNQEGWVHIDKDEISCIIYLSKNENAGTSIYRRKDFQCFPINADIKQDYYKNNKNQNDKAYKKALKQNNDLYEKTISYKSVYNRLICFDARALHGVDSFGKGEERLTLVTFFKKLQFVDNRYLQYPIPEKNRV